MAWLIHRRETGLMEAVCEHGVGHPCKQSAKYMDRKYGHKSGTWSTHGCDGCCLDPSMPDVDFRQQLVAVFPTPPEQINLETELWNNKEGWYETKWIS